MRCRLDIPAAAAPIGAWRSLVAHLLWEQRVGSSNLPAPTITPLEHHGCTGAQRALSGAGDSSSRLNEPVLDSRASLRGRPDAVVPSGRSANNLPAPTNTCEGPGRMSGSVLSTGHQRCPIKARERLRLRQCSKGWWPACRGRHEALRQATDLSRQSVRRRTDDTFDAGYRATLANAHTRQGT